MELQEARFARQRVADEHREYLRRHVEAQAAAEREKEQMGKLVGAVQDALDKTARMRERQERRWTEENVRVQRAVRAMEEEEERKRGEQEAEAAALKAKTEEEERARREDEEHARWEAEEAEALEKAAVDERAKAAEAEAKAKAAAQAQAEAEAKERARVEQEKEEHLRQEKEKENRERERAKAMAAEAEAEMARILAAKTRQAAEEKLRAEVKAKAQAAAAERLRADTEAKKRAELVAAAKRQAAESSAKAQASQTAAHDATEARKPAIVKAEPLLSPVSKLSVERSGVSKQAPQSPVTREGAATAANGVPNRSLPPTASSVQVPPSLLVPGLPHPAENIARPATQPPRLQNQTAIKPRQQLPSAGVGASPSRLSTQTVQSHKSASDTPAQTRTRQEELRAQLLEKKQETKSPSGVRATPSLGPKQSSMEGTTPASSMKIARIVWPPVSTQPVSSGMSHAASNATATQPQLATPSTTHIETRNVSTSIRATPSNKLIRETVLAVQVKAEPEEVLVPRKTKEKPAPPAPRVELQPPPQTAPAATVAVPPLASLPPKPAVPLPAPRPPKPNAAVSKTVQPPPHNHNTRNGDKSGRQPPANVVLDTGKNFAAPVSQQASAGSGSKPARSADNYASSWPQASHAQWRPDQDDDGWVTTPRDEFDRPEQSYRSPTPERRYDHYSPSPDRQNMRRPDYYVPPPRHMAMRDRLSPASRKRTRDVYSEESSYYKRPRYDNQPRSRSPYTSRRSDRAYTPPSPPVRYKSPLPPPPPRHRSPTPPLMARYSPARALSPYNPWSPASLSPQQPKTRPLVPPPPVTMPERRNVDYAPSTEEPHRTNAKVPAVTTNRKAAPQVQPLQQAPLSRTDGSPVWRAEKPTPVPVPQSRTDLLSRMSDVPQYGPDGTALARSDVPRARRGNPKGRSRGGSVAARGGGGSNRLADRFQDRPQPQKDLESRISTW